MNMFKKNGGFTLVELIVVIAILAILAGVAIPAYSGYITKAKDAGDTTVLASVLTAAQAINATSTDGDVDTIAVVCDANGSITSVTVDGTAITYASGKWSNTDFDMFMSSTQPALKGSYKTAGGANWTPAGWVAKPASN